MAKKTKEKLILPEPNLPPEHPEAIARMADAMPWKSETARNFGVEDYIDAIRKLRAREYSYADIAKWLTERLAEKLKGKKITRGQVYRVFQQDQEIHDPFNEAYSVTHISEEDAEVRAELSDKKPEPSKEELS
jgi:hypothetical protein